MSPAENYSSLIDQYSIELTKLKKQYNTLGTIRLVLALSAIYFTYKLFSTFDFLFLIPGVFALLGFVYVVIKHRAVLWEKRITANLLHLNQQEKDYLMTRSLPFSNGEKYIDSSHFYTYDLDIFGQDSLFHHLNRTTTAIGEKTLAQGLKYFLSNAEILGNQEAIYELKEKLSWRQYLAALGKTVSDSEEDYKKLMGWATQTQSQISGVVNVLSYVFPILFLGVFGAALVGVLALKWVILAFVLNLFVFGTQVKKIKAEVVDVKNVVEIIKHYGLILERIENEDFSSQKLKGLSEKLRAKNASKTIKNLSKVFLNIQGVNFDLGALLTNGTLLYHIHALRSLIQWKANNAEELKAWLDVMGEVEFLNSLANLGYNNKDFVFPELNADFVASFENLGHPLISAEVRVTNSISLNRSNFIVLTGSNMSGKSTFLRTLGINTVLTGVGAPICASHASVHPLPILVSMRQSDSLSSGESYFFAEVKRLKSIIEKLKTETCFVLLDEILRGTNSDDKQSGTIGVIQKIISLSAVGSIATHDLEVCQMAERYPDKLENKNFEVEIINDELVFDYKLRSGICQNKSATFLMKKMEII
jgi:hypothetical protein